VITFGEPASLLSHVLKVERLETDNTPQELFAKLRVDRENSFLLESASGSSKLAEYSFIGFDPSKMIRYSKGKLEVANQEDGSKEEFAVTDPLVKLRQLVPKELPSGLFRFAGGAVGFVSYDAVNCWERVPRHTPDADRFPDMEFGLFYDGIVFEHRRKEVYYFTLGENRIEEVRRATRQGAQTDGLGVSSVRTSIERAKFEETVRVAKEYVSSGDIFQVVLSRRQDFDAQGDLGRFYRELSLINPSPYMYFLKFGDRTIVGSSPEMLVRVEDRKVETFPIAGTRPHVADARRNAELAKELLADPKENAEHVMLVDLARNDVGKVSRYGSVRTPEFLEVHQYSHVQHMVSHVVGELRDEFDSYDAFRAVFPAGTVTGAPKVRAMEIIDELEPDARGPYAGAVGYISYSGNMDMCITIRTLIIKNGKIYVQAGAGIVADSSPENEYIETVNKATAMMKTVDFFN
jgi:anthranilate synthase component 1